MKNPKSLLFTLFLFVSVSAYSKDGYKITVNTGVAGDSAILELLDWNDRIRIDSADAGKNGILVFKGKNSLLPGEYSVKYGNGSFEFFVSEENGVKENFIVESDKVLHEKGTLENKYFTEFQNFLKDGWKSLSSPGQMQSLIDSLYYKSIEDTGLSLLSQFLKMSSTKGNIYDLVSDGRMEHTRFGRSYVLEHLGDLEYNSAKKAISGVDTLIRSSAENLKPLVAEAAFDLFYNSKIMGQEAVACHIAEKYFLNDSLSLADGQKRYLMQNYVMFNNSSLIGKKAPELNLEDTSGMRISLTDFTGGGEFTILYFYTDDCLNCEEQTPLIVDVMDGNDRNMLNFYSVYTGLDREKWKKYVNDNFFSYNPFVNWANVWDPEAESSYHILYGVVSTPKLFLIDRHGVIVGRELDASALKQLLDNFGAEREELRRLFDFCFATDSLSMEFVEMTVDTLCGKSRKNIGLYKKIADELYLYLANSEYYQLQQGSVYLAEHYIMPDSALWDDARYISQLEEAVKAFNMNRLGETAANLQLVNEGGSPVALWDIRSNFKVLYFYKPNCGICSETTGKLNELKARYGDRLDCAFVAVNTAQRKEEWLKYIIENDLEWINLWDDTKSNVIFANYFLKEVPQIYLLDRNNVVMAKNIMPDDLEMLFKTLERNTIEQ